MDADDDDVDDDEPTGEYDLLGSGFCSSKGMTVWGYSNPQNTYPSHVNANISDCRATCSNLTLACIGFDVGDGHIPQDTHYDNNSTLLYNCTLYGNHLYQHAYGINDTGYFTAGPLRGWKFTQGNDHNRLRSVSVPSPNNHPTTCYSKRIAYDLIGHGECEDPDGNLPDSYFSFYTNSSMCRKTCTDLLTGCVAYQTRDESSCVLFASTSARQKQHPAYASVGDGYCRTAGGGTPRFYYKNTSDENVCRRMCTTLSAACVAYSVGAKNYSSIAYPICSVYGSALPNATRNMLPPDWALIMESPQPAGLNSHRLVINETDDSTGIHCFAKQFTSDYDSNSSEPFLADPAPGWIWNGWGSTAGTGNRAIAHAHQPAADFAATCYSKQQFSIAPNPTDTTTTPSSIPTTTTTTKDSFGLSTSLSNGTNIITTTTSTATTTTAEPAANCSLYADRYTCEENARCCWELALADAHNYTNATGTCAERPPNATTAPITTNTTTAPITTAEPAANCSLYTDRYTCEENARCCWELALADAHNYTNATGTCVERPPDTTIDAAVTITTTTTTTTDTALAMPQHEYIDHDGTCNSTAIYGALYTFVNDFTQNDQITTEKCKRKCNEFGAPCVAVERYINASCRVFLQNDVIIQNEKNPDGSWENGEWSGGASSSLPRSGTTLCYIKSIATTTNATDATTLHSGTTTDTALTTTADNNMVLGLLASFTYGPGNGGNNSFANVSGDTHPDVLRCYAKSIPTTVDSSSSSTNTTTVEYTYMGNNYCADTSQRYTPNYSKLSFNGTVETCKELCTSISACAALLFYKEFLHQNEIHGFSEYMLECWLFGSQLPAPTSTTTTTATTTITTTTTTPYFVDIGKGPCWGVGGIFSYDRTISELNTTRMCNDFCTSDRCAAFTVEYHDDSLRWDCYSHFLPEGHECPCEIISETYMHSNDRCYAKHFPASTTTITTTITTTTTAPHYIDIGKGPCWGVDDIGFSSDRTISEWNTTRKCNEFCTSDRCASFTVKYHDDNLRRDCHSHFLPEGHECPCQVTSYHFRETYAHFNEWCYAKLSMLAGVRHILLPASTPAATVEYISMGHGQCLSNEGNWPRHYKEPFVPSSIECRDICTMLAHCIGYHDGRTVRNRQSRYALSGGCAVYGNNMTAHDPYNGTFVEPNSTTGLLYGWSLILSNGGNNTLENATGDVGFECFRKGTTTATTETPAITTTEDIFGPSTSMSNRTNITTNTTGTAIAPITIEYIFLGDGMCRSGEFSWPRSYWRSGKSSDDCMDICTSLDECIGYTQATLSCGLFGNDLKNSNFPDMWDWNAHPNNGNNTLVPLTSSPFQTTSGFNCYSKNTTTTTNKTATTTTTAHVVNTDAVEYISMGHGQCISNEGNWPRHYNRSFGPSSIECRDICTMLDQCIGYQDERAYNSGSCAVYGNSLTAHDSYYGTFVEPNSTAGLLEGWSLILTNGGNNTLENATGDVGFECFRKGTTTATTETAATTSTSHVTVPVQTGYEFIGFGQCVDGFDTGTRLSSYSYTFDIHDFREDDSTGPYDDDHYFYAVADETKEKCIYLCQGLGAYCAGFDHDARTCSVYVFPGNTHAELNSKLMLGHLISGFITSDGDGGTLITQANNKTSYTCFAKDPIVVNTDAVFEYIFLGTGLCMSNAGDWPKAYKQDFGPSYIECRAICTMLNACVGYQERWDGCSVYGNYLTRDDSLYDTSAGRVEPNATTRLLDGWTFVPGNGDSDTLENTTGHAGYECYRKRTTTATTTTTTTYGTTTTTATYGTTTTSTSSSTSTTTSSSSSTSTATTTTSTVTTTTTTTDTALSCDAQARIYYDTNTNPTPVDNHYDNMTGDFSHDPNAVVNDINFNQTAIDVLIGLGCTAYNEVIVALFGDLGIRTNYIEPDSSEEKAVRYCITGSVLCNFTGHTKARNVIEQTKSFNKKGCTEQDSRNTKRAKSNIQTILARAMHNTSINVSSFPSYCNDADIRAEGSIAMFDMERYDGPFEVPPDATVYANIGRNKTVRFVSGAGSVRATFVDVTVDDIKTIGLTCDDNTSTFNKTGDYVKNVCGLGIGMEIGSAGGENISQVGADNTINASALHERWETDMEAQSAYLSTDPALTDSGTSTKTSLELMVIGTVKCSANQNFVPEAYTESNGKCINNATNGSLQLTYSKNNSTEAVCKRACDSLLACSALTITTLSQNDPNDTVSCLLHGNNLFGEAKPAVAAGYVYHNVSINNNTYVAEGYMELECHHSPQSDECLHPYALATLKGDNTTDAQCFVKKHKPGTKGGKCTEYRVYQTPKTWANAEDACVYLGGHLASIHSHAEQEHVVNITQDAPLNSSETSVWIGYTDQDAEAGCNASLFTWSDNTTTNMYNNFGSDEPTDICNTDILSCDVLLHCNATGSEDCVEMFVTPSNDTFGQWNDADCAAKKPYVCMFECGANSKGEGCENAQTTTSDGPSPHSVTSSSSSATSSTSHTSSSSSSSSTSTSSSVSTSATTSLELITIDTVKCTANQSFVSEAYTEHNGTCINEKTSGIKQLTYSTNNSTEAVCKRACDSLLTCSALTITTLSQNASNDTVSCLLQGNNLFGRANPYDISGYAYHNVPINNITYLADGAITTICQTAPDFAPCLHSYAVVAFKGDNATDARCFVKQNKPGTVGGKCSSSSASTSSSSRASSTSMSSSSSSSPCTKGCINGICRVNQSGWAHCDCVEDFYGDDCTNLQEDVASPTSSSTSTSSSSSSASSTSTSPSSSISGLNYTYDDLGGSGCKASGIGATSTLGQYSKTNVNTDEECKQYCDKEVTAAVTTASSVTCRAYAWKLGTCLLYGTVADNGFTRDIIQNNDTLQVHANYPENNQEGTCNVRDAWHITDIPSRFKRIGQGRCTNAVSITQHAQSYTNVDLITCETCLYAAEAVQTCTAVSCEPNAFCALYGLAENPTTHLHGTTGTTWQVTGPGAASNRIKPGETVHEDTLSDTYQQSICFQVVPGAIINSTSTSSSTSTATSTSSSPSTATSSSSSTSTATSTSSSTSTTSSSSSTSTRTTGTSDSSRPSTTSTSSSTHTATSSSSITASTTSTSDSFGPSTSISNGTNTSTSSSSTTSTSSSPTLPLKEADTTDEVLLWILAGIVAFIFSIVVWNLCGEVAKKPDKSPWGSRRTEKQFHNFL